MLSGSDDDEDDVTETGVKECNGSSGNEAKLYY
jgi:hypothetical protein